jgi:hypothetical protein
MTKFRDTWLVVLALVCSPAWCANPELKAYEQGIEDAESVSKALQLADLSLDVDVVGALADVTLTARFANPSEEVLEGRFELALPDDAVVTGFALDVEGQLVDGVLQEPLKARRAFEEKVRQGIDPGLAEVSRGNRFSTRVYPILPRAGRTIRLRFAAPIHAVRGLVLPLKTDAVVEQFRFTLTSTAHASRPEIELPGRSEASWEQKPSSHRATLALRGAKLAGQFRIAPVRVRHAALLSRHSNGDRRVHIVDRASRVAAVGRTGQRLRVYWDRSLSRQEQRLADERRLLTRYVEQSRPKSIDLVTFNSSGASLHRVTTAELDPALTRLRYLGGTSFAVLEKLAVPAADQCLVFTDGVATIDARPELAPGCEVFAITSAADADIGMLTRLAGGSAGAVLRVGRQSEAEILARLGGSRPRVVGVFTEEGRPLAFSALPGGESGWSVIAEAPAGEPESRAILVRIAGVSAGTQERRYTPSLSRRAAFDPAGALWAADRVARYAAEEGAREKLVQLSRRFSVASPHMSFLVLESPRDYVDADLEPPSTYPPQRMAEYREARREREQWQRESRAERIEELVEGWRDVVAWWETPFDPNARKPEPKKVAGPAAPAGVAAAPAAAAAAGQELDEIQESVSVRREAMGVVDSIAAEDIGGFPDETDEVLVTGARASVNEGMLARISEVAMPANGNEIEIGIEKWSVQRPYIQALDAAARADVDAAIVEQQRQFGSLPVFWFDVAEWLRLHGREQDSEEFLLSALDLPVANEETAAMVAERLMRHGGVDRAIWLLERAAEQSDYLPQTRRTLALALAARSARPDATQARADLERAIGLLNEVVMGSWSGNYEGIEMVSLMEVNALLPRARAAGLRRFPLDERLQKLLDVDLRVVIEWNTGATDMDLWVDEPNGERAFYSNPRTAIGGRLSNDITDGYGPEEYLLRRAAKGEFRISVNVYETDVINPNGSTVVTARLYRNFGRPGQSEQTLEIELLPDDKGEKRVGTFIVK